MMRTVVRRELLGIHYSRLPRSLTRVTGAGSAPERSTKARSSADCCEVVTDYDLIEDLAIMAAIDLTSSLSTTIDLRIGNIILSGKRLNDNASRPSLRTALSSTAVIISY